VLHSRTLEIMEKVKIHDKEFKVSITAAEIQKRIAELGKQLSLEMEGKKPMFIAVLNGSFLFAADLLKNVSCECEITFVRVSSYAGTQSTGTVRNLVGLNEKIEDRTIILVEDIVDSGDTVVYLLNELKKEHPKEIKIASLLLKPKALKHDLHVDYTGFEVPNDFLVGYGLDYDGIGRNLNDIYTLI
jgi:hypoxanthine phosphoribosyltransferase